MKIKHVFKKLKSHECRKYFFSFCYFTFPSEFQQRLRLTYMMKYVAQAFWKESDIRCFPPYQKVQANK